MRIDTITRLLTLSLAIAASAVPAIDTATPIRSGHFREVTDVASAGHVILNLRMSADGSRIVYLTTTGVFPETLRVVGSDGSGATVIHQNPPDGAYPRVMDSFAISDDGSTVVYGLLVNPANNDSELRVHDTTTGADRLLLREVTHLSFGVSSPVNIAHLQSTRLLALAGDGTVVHFLNRFGPIGSGNAGQDPSGQTLYAVDVATGTPTPLFSQSDLPDVAAISPFAVELLTSGGSLATDGDGSVVMLPVGGSGASANPPHSLLRLDPAVGAASAEVVLELTGTLFTGPSVSTAGDLMALTRAGGDLLPAGLMAMSPGGGAPTVLDTGFLASRPPVNPRLSGDGTAVSYRIELGGSDEPSVRWIATSGSAAPVPVSQNTVDAGGSSSGVHDISSDGTRIAFLGGVRAAVGGQPADLVIFDWAAAPVGTPAVTAVRADPSLDFVIQPFLSAEVTHSFSYDTTGADRALAQSWIYDAAGRDLRGLQFSGIGNFFSDVADDGTGGDAIADDGTYDDAGIWAFSAAVPGTVTGRAAITATTGRASFVDFPITVRAPVPPTASFEARPRIGVAPLTVTFENTSSGDYAFTDYDTNGDTVLDRFAVANPFQLTYDTPGTRDVAMRARGFGNEDTATIVGAVVVLPSGGEIDLGDAPDPSYPTLLASDGAAHVLGSGLFLGAGVDGEADGQPSASATGDTDDGLVLTSDPLIGSPLALEVTASASGRLNAWIDYNRDGDWTDPGEHVLDDVLLAPGPNALVTAAIPDDATPGTTFARLRLDSVGGLEPTGPASDGEVEDHALVLVSPDSDGDGLTDWEERNVHGTDPTLADTDGDRRTDGDEVSAGRNPLVNEAASVIPLILDIVDERR
ncbi:MAG: hypothetical protein H6837_17205 [Planctomycetes bacterium]|nr:hypothetical protein [Planctomycetota bacterium]